MVWPFVNKLYGQSLKLEEMYTLDPPVIQYLAAVIIAFRRQNRGNFLEVVQNGGKVNVAGVQDKVDASKSHCHLTREGRRSVRDMCIRKQSNAHQPDYDESTAWLSNSLWLFSANLCTRVSF